MDFHPPGVPIAVLAASGHILMALDKLSRWRRSVVLSRSPQNCGARGRRFRGSQRRPRTPEATGLQSRRKSGTERAGPLRSIRKGASRRRRLHGILHWAGVTDIPLRTQCLTCGVLAGGSASGTADSRQNTTAHAEWRMFTWRIGMRSMACSSAKCCSETGEKSLTGAGGIAEYVPRIRFNRPRSAVVMVGPSCIGDRV